MSRQLEAAQPLRFNSAEAAQAVKCGISLKTVFILQIGGYVFEGYSSVIKLSDKELNMLYDVVIARFTLSVSIGSETILSGGGNDYIEKCVNENIVYLQKLTNFGRETFNKVVIGI